MPITRTISLHEDRVIWSDMKSLAEVLELKATTLPSVWETTYQGNSEHSLFDKIFQMDWFKNRYTYRKPMGAVGRWISLDTALSDSETAAFSSATVGDLMPDYTLNISYNWTDKVQFPYLIQKILELAETWNYDGNLQGIIIENKSSGISAIQSLKTSAPKWIQDIIRPYTPKMSKEMRWGESAIWCSLDCVHLPYPDENVPWLFELESDLRDAPDVMYKDRLDSFAQLVLFLDLLIGDAYRLRQGVN